MTSLTPVRALVRSARPARWPRNLLVLAVPVTVGTLTAHVALTALAFVLASAATYLFNAVTDQVEDVASGRQHRLDAGLRVSALAVAAVLAALSLACSGDAQPLVAAYLCLTAAYSLALRRVPGLEILVVASGFSLRVLAGGAAVSASLTVSLPIALAAGCAACTAVTVKRASEIASGSHRPVLVTYTLSGLRRWGRTASIAAVWLAVASVVAVGGQWPMALLGAVGAWLALQGAQRFTGSGGVPVALETEVLRRAPVALGVLLVAAALVLA